jgi:hypothetical protein
LGASPPQPAADEPTTLATKVPWPTLSAEPSGVQLVHSATRMFADASHASSPVSKIATTTPSPLAPRAHSVSAPIK